jgi:hypothetical protein
LDLESKRFYSPYYSLKEHESALFLCVLVVKQLIQSHINLIRMPSLFRWQNDENMLTFVLNQIRHKC